MTRCTKITALLLVGAMLNIGVAWACAAFSLPAFQAATVLTAGEFDPGGRVCERRDHSLAAGHWQGFGITEYDVYGPWDWPPEGADLSMWIDAGELAEQVESIIRDTVLKPDARAELGLRRQLHGISPESIKLRTDAGWPFRSLRGYLAGSQGPWLAIGGVEIDKPLPDFRGRQCLPFMPIWPGFLANTVLYAGLAWLLTCSLLFTRQRLRLRGGRCPTCRYPIGASEVCTECGAALPAQSAPVDMFESVLREQL